MSSGTSAPKRKCIPTWEGQVQNEMLITRELVAAANMITASSIEDILAFLIVTSIIARQIALELERQHDLNVSCQAVSKFLTQYHLTHHIVRKPGTS